MIKKSIDEINEKIGRGEAVVLTAEEVSKMAEELSPSEIVKRVDIVTTGTFAPMCSSGVFINFGHPETKIRMEELTLNNVPAYGGLAAVDTYIGATSESPDNPKYGGGHVIEELIKGNDIFLKAKGKGTDCYPGKYIETYINKATVNEIIMFNPRNVYQNYGVAVNSSSRIKHTYMGTLLPKFGNANYSTSGELSPLLNDPYLRTIGIGTRIFLGGAEGQVAWNGTQFNTSKPRNEHGVPLSGAATLALIGNAKEMNSSFIKGAYFEKYGTTLFVGVGIPIPVIDEDIASSVSIKNREIETTIYDYSLPDCPALGKTNYEELRSGRIILNGRGIRTAPLSSLKKAREIAEITKTWINNKEFYLATPSASLPSEGIVQPLRTRREK